MMDYSTKCYGRNDEVAAIYRMFDAGMDISMPGPRRLGKTFVLDRLVDAATHHNWTAVKVEVAGCRDTRSFCRELCAKIGSERSGGSNAVTWFRQRLAQVFDFRTDDSGPWYRALLSTDHEIYFERLINAMNDDPANRWVLLIDELPIFLKALHDKGPMGIDEARDFMNLTSRLRTDNKNVRWMITGSIGLEPLAEIGNYMGVLAKFQTYALQPLDNTQAKELIMDLAHEGRLMSRHVITEAEAQCVVDAVGWLSAFYLEALAQKLAGEPSDDPVQAKSAVDGALDRLIQPSEAATFGVWEEHLRKHYRDNDRSLAFQILAALAPHAKGRTIDELLIAVDQPGVTADRLRTVLMRLSVDGFLTVDDWESSQPTATFLNLPLRRWWARYRPADT